MNKELEWSEEETWKSSQSSEGHVGQHRDREGNVGRRHERKNTACSGNVTPSI